MIVGEWLIVGVPAALLTAALVAWGLRKQRQKPERRWPIVAVGLLAGLVAGLAMLQATWAESRWPHRRRLIDAATIVVSAILVLATAYTAYGPTLDLGPRLGGGRIERPGHGFALTFPRDWTVQEVTPEGVRSMWGDADLPAGQSIVLAAERSLRGGYCFVIFDDPSLRGEPVLLATYATATARELTEEDTAAEVESRRIELPAGPAWRFDLTASDLSATDYVLRGSRGLYTLSCLGDDPPPDRWSSIAEAFEFLPDAATGTVPPSPVLGSGRIHWPTGGVAFTMPAGWTAEVVDATTSAWFYDDTEAGDVREQILLWATDDETDASCFVVDYAELAAAPPTWFSVVQAANGFREWREGDERYVRVVRSYERYPAGLTGHVSATDTDGWFYDLYLFHDAQRWLYVECRSPVSGDDARAMAETFELLPADEVAATGQRGPEARGSERIISLTASPSLAQQPET